MDSNNWRVKRDPSDIPVREQTPKRTFPRRDIDTERSGSFDQQRQSPIGTPLRQSRDSLRKPLGDQKAEQAVEEGRRVYVGNLPYEATVKDVETLFASAGAGVEAINMSVAPMTGRNPSYCFVDLATKELAERIMAEYDGREFLGRPLRVRPGVRASGGAARGTKGDGTVFDRWRRVETPEPSNTATREGRRLYVGGLPRFGGQADTDVQIRDLFEEKGFRVEVISKLISRHESKRDDEGNHNYCFVDMASTEAADAAIAALNGAPRWGWNVKVSRASGAPSTPVGKRRVYVGGLPEFDGEEKTEEGVRELFEPFEVKVVSKLFSPREPKTDESGNHCFCFVELKDEAQTDAAIEALDWKEMWGWKVRVKPALSAEKQQQERPAPRGWRA